MRFPILQDYDYRRKQYKDPSLPEYPTSVPWALVAAYSEQIQKNHGQSLARLAERGGLSAVELMHAIDGSNPFRSTGEVIYPVAGAVRELRRHVRRFEKE